MLLRRIVLGFVLPAASIIFFWQALEIADVERRVAVQPGSWPSVLGLALVISSLAISVNELLPPVSQRAKQAILLRSADARQGATGEPDRSAPDGPSENESVEGSQPDEGETVSSPKDVFLVLAAFGLYIVSFVPVGFYLSTSAFVFGLSTAFDRAHPVRNAVVAFILTTLLGIIFYRLLGIGLPIGVYAPAFVVGT